MVAPSPGCTSDIELIDDGKDHSGHAILNPYTGVLELPVKYPCIDLVSSSDDGEYTEGARRKKKRVWRKTDKHEWLKIYRNYMQQRSKRQPEPLNNDVTEGQKGFRHSGREGERLKQDSSKDDETDNLELDNLESVKTINHFKRLLKRRKTRRQKTEVSESDNTENLDGNLIEHPTLVYDPGNAEETEIDNSSMRDFDNEGMVGDFMRVYVKTEHENLPKLDPDTDEAVYLDLTDSDEDESDAEIKVEAKEGSNIKIHKDIEYKMEDFFMYDRAKTNTKKVKLLNLKYNSLKLLNYSNICLFKWTKYYFVCYHCLEWFKGMQMLRSHVQENHTRDQITTKVIKEIHRYYKADVTDLKCRICTIELTNLGDLEYHLKRHGIKFKPGGSSLIPYKLCSGNFICQVCGVMFGTRYRLQKHVDGHFLSYVCPECNMGFSNARTLKKHCQDHKSETNEDQNTKSLNFNKRGVVKDRDRCRKKFRGDFKKLHHMIEEQDKESKMFQCEFCPKAFMTVHWLTKHKNCVHQDELYD